MNLARFSINENRHQISPTHSASVGRPCWYYSGACIPRAFGLVRSFHLLADPELFIKPLVRHKFAGWSVSADIDDNHTVLKFSWWEEGEKGNDSTRGSLIHVSGRCNASTSSPSKSTG